jgi:fatty acid desaturase
MWVGLNAAFFSSYYLGGTGRVSLWMGTVMNSVVGYVAFSVVHDSLHRAVSTNTKLNDWIGQLALLLVALYVSLKLFRWGHILHHRCDFLVRMSVFRLRTATTEIMARHVANNYIAVFRHFIPPG